MLQVSFHPKATKELLRIPKKMRLQVLDKIAELEKVNHPLQCPKVEKLRARKTEDFRLRSGNYRVKFTLIDPGIIKIIHIEHRQVGY